MKNPYIQDLELTLMQCLQHFDRITTDQETCQTLRQCLQGWVHEFRTSLSPIIGFSLLLLKDTSLTPTQQEHVENIYQGSQALLSAINAFTDSIKYRDSSRDKPE